MFRYLIIAWNIEDAFDREAVCCMRRRIFQSASGWRSTIDQPGLYVACLDREFRSNSSILIDSCRGVILGAVFPSPGLCYSEEPTPVRRLTEGQAGEILRSVGRSLISDYWGHYVAVLHYPEKRTAVVLRGPVSPLACFHVKRGTVNVFFSHLNDCIDLRITSLSINWDSITAQVIGGHYLCKETAIEEIDDVECGESVHCNPCGCSKQAYWDPRSFLEERSQVSFGEAAQTVRRATEYCISALSSQHERILVNLSGGLDSSIVLSSLARASHKPSITAVNYYSGGSGDERRFARSMAGRVNCALRERPRNQRLDLRRFLDCNRTVRPVLNFSAPDVELRNVALASDLNATAIFDGELGDNLFGSNPDPGTLIECFRQNGLRRRFRCAVMDYAMLTRQSLWRTLALARREAKSASADADFSISTLMQGLFGKDHSKWALLASAEAKERHRGRANRFLHPWFKQSRRIAPGSYALLFGLITVTSTTYHSPFSSPQDPRRVSPLVSQPLIEVALSIPPHLNFNNAQNRAVARAAFADALPSEILQRGLGKGGPTLWLRGVIENNADFLREFLLDGILVRQRLIDRARLESALSPRIVKSAVIAGDIFAKLYIEVWLRAAQETEATSYVRDSRALG